MQGDTVLYEAAATGVVASAEMTTLRGGASTTAAALAVQTMYVRDCATVDSR
jgi:hypothetical protein